jgi:uncharacterized protein (UPF0332 family)
MTPTEFVTFAARLAAMAIGNEAGIRTVVGRAYYGAFHLALAYLAELGVEVPANANAHGLVGRYFSGSAHPEAGRVARLLSDMHTMRIRADYRLSDARFQSFEIARRYVESAEDVRSLLDHCRQEPVRGEVLAGINAYLTRLN